MKTGTRIAIAAALVVCTARESHAVTLPRVFGDHMVLQRGVKVPVWGWAAPGERVVVRFAGQEKAATAGDDGRWEVRLDPLEASAEPRELAAAGAETVTFKDVLVGEVWLCSGQSNMEMPVGKAGDPKPTTNADQELRDADLPRVRLLKVARARASKPARDLKGEWAVCGPDALDRTRFSAVGFFFGRRVHRELKVPVGLIDATFGGSLIEWWVPPSGFAAVPALADWAKTARSPGATRTVYQGLKAIEVEPCVMYRGMVAPLVPFAIRGVLWYQGESNVYAGDGAEYADKLAALIKGWRAEWGAELPVYYVQVAPLLYHVTRPHLVTSAEALPRLWEAQAACLRLPRTGMVVTTDLVADLEDIHPRDKRPVGERLALWALAREYDRPGVVPSGPVFRGLEVAGDRAVLSFDHVGGGLVSRRGPALSWFAVAGADGVYHPAAAAVEGDTVVVTSPKAPAPVAVRFAWDEAARPNFFNKAGLPAVPFRTDSPLLRAPKDK